MRAAVQEPPAKSGIELANWNWKVVHQYVAERYGACLSRSSIRVRCQAICLVQRVAALPGLRHPWSSSAGHGVELQQQLVHHRHHGHIAWLPALPQTVIEPS